MQQHCTELTQKLLNSIDKEYNVVDMGAVVDVITALEKTTITKEVLESTRLGKHINELRRQTTNDALAKRAKDLVRRWREMVLPPANSLATPVAALQGLNGTKPQSPGIRGVVKSRSPPGTRIAKPQSPLLRDGTPLKVLSPALSLTSEHSRSPNPTPIKHAALSQANRYNQTSPKLSATSQNHALDAVPRTHSSNKRLRKDEADTYSPLSSSLKDDNIIKKQRINGENINININTNSQVPSPSPINSTIDDNIIVDDNNDPNDSVDIGIGPKKRGRKKGSKSLKNQQLQQDRVKEKLASISRNPKLKTTQELLADLQARGSTITGAGTGNRTVTEPPTTEEILRNSDDINYSRNNRNKLPNSTNLTNNNGDDIEVVDIDNFDDEKIQTYHDPTVEEILAKLPPLDRDSIRWSDDDDDEPLSPAKRDITHDDVDRLHNDCAEGINGNYQVKLTHSDGNDDGNNDVCDIKRIPGIYRRRSNDPDREFKEWHEMLARPSYDGQILHILPYVIID